MKPSASLEINTLEHARAWLTLLGSRLTLQKQFDLLSTWGTVEALLEADATMLESAGLAQAEIAALKSPDYKQIATQLDWINATHTHLIDWKNPAYPPQLREIARPPIALFVQGNVTLLHRPQLAMVGTRTPSATGLEIAHTFAHTLSREGLMITSGLALGIDGASHQGALSARSPQIAVLGCGLDIIYPKAHVGLAQEILTTGGAIISEFLPETPPKPRHFPQRNRIISGLSMGVLVVEAAYQSGSLITARWALEQGREVFAIPGTIHHPQAKGCHQLLKQGAKLVETTQDIWEELPVLPELSSDCIPLKRADKMPPIISNPETRVSMQPNRPLPEQLLMTYLGPTVTAIETLIQHTGLPAHEVSAQLLMLELHGFVLSVPGGYVKRKA